MARHSIILDCDPGQDDAVALLLALASPEEIELLAVTTVAGNVPLALTQRNARQILELAGRRDVPVHAGCDRPMVRPLETAEYVHGETGLNGVELPEPALPPASGHAVDAIIERVMARPEGSVTLCPIGPLTNVALAMLKEPRLAPAPARHRADGRGDGARQRHARGRVQRLRRPARRLGRVRGRRAARHARASTSPTRRW